MPRTTRRLLIRAAALGLVGWVVVATEAPFAASTGSPQSRRRNTSIQSRRRRVKPDAAPAVVIPYHLDRRRGSQVLAAPPARDRVVVLTALLCCRRTNAGRKVIAVRPILHGEIGATAGSVRR